MLGWIQNLALGGGIASIPQVSPCPVTVWLDIAKTPAVWSDISATTVTWTDSTKTPTLWSHSQDCLKWDGGDAEWDLVGNVYTARWR